MVGLPSIKTVRYNITAIYERRRVGIESFFRDLIPSPLAGEG